MTKTQSQNWQTSDCTGLAFRVMGAGPNLLLISGLNGKAQFWEACAADLAKQFRVVTFDQRGCGASPDDGQEWSIEILGDHAIALADEVFSGEPYAVVGHSTGGAIAQYMLAQNHLAIRAGVLSGTWARADPYMQALFELRLSLLERAPDLDPILGHLLRDIPQDFTQAKPSVALPPSVARRRMRALLAHDSTRYLADVNAPTLVMGAKDDRIVPFHLSERLCALLPQGQMFCLKDGGHFFPQTQRTTFVARLAEWSATHFAESQTIAT